MGIQLLIAGRRPDDHDLDDTDMDAVAGQVVQTPAFQVRRCDHPFELPAIVEAVAQQYGRIGVLDLYDHAAPGQQHLGSDVWLSSDADPRSPLHGAGLVLDLRDSLSDLAQVRLLGCRTALTQDPPPGPQASGAPGSGRLLLVKAARLLGGRRVVLGTIAAIEDEHFGPLGFRRELELDLLFSSLAALDGPAPTATDRVRHLAAIKP